MSNQYQIKKGDIFKSARVDLARGLLNPSNERNQVDGKLAFHKTDAEYWATAKRQPVQTDKHRITRTVEVDRVLKTKAVGYTIRKGDIFEVETPMPFNPANGWTATARVDAEHKSIVKLSDLSATETAI